MCISVCSALLFCQYVVLASIMQTSPGDSMSASCLTSYLSYDPEQAHHSGGMLVEEHGGDWPMLLALDVIVNVTERSILHARDHISLLADNYRKHDQVP